MNKKQNEKIESAESIPFHESMEACGLPIVTFKVGDEDINFMLDSGGMKSFIDSRVVQLLNLPYEPVNANVQIYGITGDVDKSSKIHMNFRYRDTEFSFDIVAHNLGNALDMVKEEYGIRIHGMLGSDFLEKYRCVLDFDDMVAYINKQ
jgi:hypothetical protein